MPIKILSFSGGLVDAKDASLLAEDELSRADDIVYKPNDPAVHKAPGRSDFNTTAESSAIKGAAFLEFDGTIQDVFVDHVGAGYRVANAGHTGTFSKLVDVTTGGPTMVSVHYNNEHFLMNGVDRNQVVTTKDGSGNTVNPPGQDSTFFHGMLANVSAPTLTNGYKEAATPPTLAKYTGTGAGFTLTTGATITYWIEERLKVAGIVTQRNAAETATTVTLTGSGTTTLKPLLTRPATVNATATHWVLFATATDGTFPDGAEILEVPISTTTISDVRTGLDPAIPGGDVYTESALQETGFVLTSGSTITYWVEERVKVGDLITKRNASSSDETVTLTGDGATTNTPLITRPDVVNSDATHWALFGTSSTGSFPTGAEIAEVAISVPGIGDTRTGPDPAFPSGSTYELWVASLGGAVISVPRNGQPPIATTGEVFEDSIVTNDISDERAIRYSWPDKPHQFPLQQRIPFETKEHDQVILIKRMGSVLMVALRDSLWCVNILPRPEDASFDVARIKEQVEGAFGCVGPYAGTTFSFGRGLRFAYVSTSGIVMANEAEWDVLTDDINWEKHIAIEYLSKSVLVDNPQEFRLQFYYTPKGQESNQKAFYLHYHPSQLKGGNRPKMKVTGPIDVKARAAFVATLDSKKEVFTSNVGKLWLEGGSLIDESGGTISAVVRTGDLFLGGLGADNQVRTIWVHHQKSVGNTATAYMNQRNEGDDDVEERKPFNLDRREHTQVAMTGQAEAFQFGVESNHSGQPMIVDYIAIETAQPTPSKEG